MPRNPPKRRSLHQEDNPFSSKKECLHFLQQIGIVFDEELELSADQNDTIDAISELMSDYCHAGNYEAARVVYQTLRVLEQRYTQDTDTHTGKKSKKFTHPPMIVPDEMKEQVEAIKTDNSPYPEKPTTLTTVTECYDLVQSIEDILKTYQFPSSQIEKLAPYGMRMHQCCTEQKFHAAQRLYHHLIAMIKKNTLKKRKY